MYTLLKWNELNFINMSIKNIYYIKLISFYEVLNDIYIKKFKFKMF